MTIHLDLKQSITLTSSNDITQICKPLFELLDINYFDFRRVYSDGRRIRLSTNPECTEYYFKSNYFKRSRNNQYFKLYQSDCLLWDHFLAQEILDDNRLVMLEMRNFNIDHAFTTIKHHADYVDVFSFGTDTYNYNANNTYLINMRAIDKFTNYFIVKANKIITKAEKDSFFTPLRESFFEQKSSKIYDREAYNIIKIEKMLFKLNHQNIMLSRRETDCLVNLIKGYTAKESAKLLNLSPRTVETYLEKIKVKINCESRQKIIESALNCPTVQYLIEEKF